MLDIRNKKLGFTLIETIVALFLLSIIAVFLLPSLNNLIANSNKTKEIPQIVAAVEYAIEDERSLKTNSEYGIKIKSYNGYEVTVTRSKYSNNLDKIKAVHGNYELEVLEVVDEKAWFHTN